MDKWFVTNNNSCNDGYITVSFKSYMTYISSDLENIVVYIDVNSIPNEKAFNAIKSSSHDIKYISFTDKTPQFFDGLLETINTKQHNKAGSLKDLNIYLKVAKDLNLNLALIGAHGRAKTASIQEYASKTGYQLITKILSCLEPTDMIGLPVTNESEETGRNVTINFYPEWLVDACDPNKKVILFFDEFNNAEKDVQASILNLIEDRSIDNMKLADTTQIIIAFNPPSIAPNAHELSKATRDRICVIPINDNDNSFKEYYINNNMAALCEIIDELDPINNYDEEIMKAAYKNAEFTYRSLEKAYKITKYCIDNNISDHIGISLVNGYGGKTGKTIYKMLKDKLTMKSHNNDFITRVKNAKIPSDIIPYLSKQLDTLDFKSTINKVKIIEEHFNKKDFEEILNAVFTKEFITAYKTQ